MFKYFRTEIHAIPFVNVAIDSHRFSTAMTSAADFVCNVKIQRSLYMLKRNILRCNCIAPKYLQIKKILKHIKFTHLYKWTHLLSIMWKTESKRKITRMIFYNTPNMVTFNFKRRRLSIIPIFATILLKESRIRKDEFYNILSSTRESTRFNLCPRSSDKTHDIRKNLNT